MLSYLLFDVFRFDYLESFAIGTCTFLQYNSHVDAMSATNFCCTHPQQRIDTPEPPSRPLASIDGIFAAAALPEDHPHALKFPDRKPELDASIVRSPNLASKIKLQFRRKSMRNLSKEKDYDDDAHQMTSQEVLHDIEEDTARVNALEDTIQYYRFGSVLDVKDHHPLDADAAKPEARSSKLRSDENPEELVQKSI